MMKEIEEYGNFGILLDDETGMIHAFNDEGVDLSDGVMKAFRVRYKCLNCGNTFAEEYERGDEIREQLEGVYLKSHKCTGSISCPYCRYIKCPVCKSERLVIVIEREPL